MRVGDPVWVLDGSGRLAHCSIEAVTGDRLVVSIGRVQIAPRGRPTIAVYQGAAKGIKLGDLVERLGELGAAEFHVFSAARSVVRWTPDKRAGLAGRWRARSRSAAKLSGRPWVIEVGEVLGWGELVSRIAGESTALVLWEEASEPLRDHLPPDPDRVAIVVGPEGGLTPEEAAELAAAGAHPVSLGPSIFRTDNAAVVAGAAIAWHYGLIG
jgi:16S rRNA (uracil1498-N3)-methyltransferase